QQCRIGSDPVVAWSQPQLDARPTRCFLMLADYVREPFTEVQCLPFRLDPTVIEGVEVEDRTEQLRNVEQRSIDVIHQPTLVFAQARLTQASSKQAYGMNRLTQVMTGLSEKA